MKYEWELVESSEVGDYTERLHVYGGWLVRTYFGLPATTLSMIFVPDPDHKWKIDDETTDPMKYDPKPGWRS